MSTSLDGPDSLIEKALGRYSEDGVLGLCRSVLDILTSTPPARILAFKWCSARNPISYKGVRLDVSLPIVREQIPRIFYGKYEREIVGFIKYLDPSLPIIEFGGGIGYVACQVNCHQQDGVKQIVVEPNPKILPVLRANRDLNDSDFVIDERAYSATCKRVLLEFENDFTQASSTRSIGQSTEVETVSLAELVDAHGLTEFGLIVDMEGAEIELIEEELDVIQQRCSFVIIEYHAFEEISDNVAAARDTFESAGFDLLDEDGGQLTKCVYRKSREKTTDIGTSV